jgi:hypothetical protein
VPRSVSFGSCRSHFFYLTGCWVTALSLSQRSKYSACRRRHSIVRLTIRRFQRQLSSDNPTYLAKRERVYEGMRMAGVPEG